MHTTLKLLLYGAMLFFLQCAKTVSVTETDTGQISGWVVNGQGTGIHDAGVLLRSADIPDKVAPGVRDIDSAKTAADGSFVFGKIAAGDYIIEINDHDSLGSIAEATITRETPDASVDTVKIVPFGNIRGSIDPSMVSGDSTYLYIVELDRRVPVDSLGHFLTGKLPAWKYTVRLVANATVTPSRLDTVVIFVPERDTVAAYNIGTKSGSVTVDGSIEE